MKIPKLMLIALTIILFSCKDDCPKEELLAWVVTANATVDADKALKVGDSRYKAVYGYTISIPGIKEELASNILKSKNYIPLKGTADALCSDNHMKLNDKARAYASEYNLVINQGSSNAL